MAFFGHSCRWHLVFAFLLSLCFEYWAKYLLKYNRNVERNQGWEPYALDSNCLLSHSMVDCHSDHNMSGGNGWQHLATNKRSIATAYHCQKRRDNNEQRERGWVIFFNSLFTCSADFFTVGSDHRLALLPLMHLERLSPLQACSTYCSSNVHRWGRVL